MAEGRSLSKSLLHASEEVHDCNCSPCLDEGRYSEALKYCVSCKLYYCKKCLGDHNKFPALKGHRMQDVASMKKSTTPPAGTKVEAAPLTEPCEHHPDEIIKMYCSKHDVVCCTVCIALDHRDCEGVDYIPKLAKGVKSSEKFQEFVDSMAELKEQYQELEEQIQEEIQHFTNIKDEIIKDIKHFKKEIIAKIDELETRSMQRVNERWKQLKERMSVTISKVTKSLEQIRYDLQELDKESEAALFVRMKRASRLEVEKDGIDREINEFEGFNFSLDKRVQDVLDQTDGLVKDYAPRKLVVKSKHEVTFDSDKTTCSIADICVLIDGSIVMADTENDCVKRFSKTFAKVEKIFPNGKPFGICKSSTSDEFVVTLYSKQEAQFVKYSHKTMNLTKCFGVGAPCRGICLTDDYFFISCGGGPCSVHAHLRKFDLSGNMLCTIETDDTGNRLFVHPRHLTLSLDRTKIYVTDRVNGVIVLDKTGKKLGQYRHLGLKGAFLVCCSMHGNFVSGDSSNNIQQFDDNNRFIGTAFNLCNDLQEPLVLCLNKPKDQMILSMNVYNKVLFMQFQK